MTSNICTVIVIGLIFAIKFCLACKNNQCNYCIGFLCAPNDDSCKAICYATSNCCTGCVNCPLTENDSQLSNSNTKTIIFQSGIDDTNKELLKKLTLSTRVTVETRNNEKTETVYKGNGTNLIYRLSQWIGTEQPITILYEDSEDCSCNRGDKCCCAPGWICCNTAGRCCCRSGL